MEYALNRYYPRWTGLVVGWPEVRIGLALIPHPYYMLLAALLPLLTTATLLLEAAPAIPNVVVGAGLAAVVAVVGWLINRTIATNDATNARLETAINALAKLVGEIGTEQKASSKLTEYLEKRVYTLELKKEVLEKSFQEMDKLIAVKLAEKHGNA